MDRSSTSSRRSRAKTLGSTRNSTRPAGLPEEPRYGRSGWLPRCRLYFRHPLEAHVRLFAVLFCIIPLGAIARSQIPVAQQPGMPAGNSAETIVRRVDGGAGNGIMQSLFIPPKAGAPFSLTLSTEWTRPLPGGGTWTLVNERHIMRDSKGRIYQERWILVPKGGP